LSAIPLPAVVFNTLQLPKASLQWIKFQAHHVTTIWASKQACEMSSLAQKSIRIKASIVTGLHPADLLGMSCKFEATSAPGRFNGVENKPTSASEAADLDSTDCWDARW
jgi:hypothetical protein